MQCAVLSFLTFCSWIVPCENQGRLPHSKEFSRTCLCKLKRDGKMSIVVLSARLGKVKLALKGSIEGVQPATNRAHLGLLGIGTPIIACLGTDLYTLS